MVCTTQNETFHFAICITYSKIYQYIDKLRLKRAPGPVLPKQESLCEPFTVSEMLWLGERSPRHRNQLASKETVLLHSLVRAQACYGRSTQHMAGVGSNNAAVSVYLKEHWCSGVFEHGNTTGTTRKPLREL